MNYKKVLPVILITFSLHAFASAQNNETEKNTIIQKMVNQYVEKYSNTDVKNKGEGISGIQLTVLQDGKIQTFVAGTIGHNITTPVTLENIFAWGSITDEKSIRPRKWQDVKIVQLLHMTSGIPNAINAKTIDTFWNKKTLFETNWQPNQIVEIAAKYTRSGYCKHQCFTPGTSYSYSNVNYIIADMIAEKAKKSAFDSQMQTLLKNAGVTAYYAPLKRPGTFLNGMVHGYYYDAEYSLPPVKDVPLGFDSSNTLQWSGYTSAGALIGNTQNMAQAVYKLFNGKILSENSIKVLNNDYYVNEQTGKPVSNIAQCTKKNTGNNGCFGLGVGVLHNKTLGFTWIYEGLVTGYRSIYFWAPKENTIVSISVNNIAGDNDHLVKFATDVFNMAVNNTKNLSSHLKNN